MDFEPGAAANPRRYLDATAMRPYDLRDEGQTQTGADSFWFGGEERFEYLPASIDGDAGATVLDRQQHIVPGDAGGDDDDVPLRRTFGHCLGRVHQQVRHDLTQPTTTAEDRRYRPKVDDELGVRPNCRFGQTARDADHVLELNGAKHLVVRARKGSQVPREPPNPIESFARVLQGHVDRVDRRNRVTTVPACRAPARSLDRKPCR